MNLQDLYETAWRWVPKSVRWNHLLETPNSWGPAHELGHALIEPRWRWKFQNYERCSLGSCLCDTLDSCHVYEAAAMLVSRALLRATGNEFIADREIDDTTDYDMLEPSDFKRAKALLKRKKLWPVPRTKPSLERALRYRLGKPRGQKPKPPKLATVRGSTAMGMFVNML